MEQVLNVPVLRQSRPDWQEEECMGRHIARFDAFMRGEQGGVQ